MSKRDDMALLSLYLTVSEGYFSELDIATMMASLGIEIPADFCNASNANDVAACASVDCPEDFDIPGPSVACFSRFGASAVRLQPPFPLFRLGDFPTANVHQFSVYEMKFGGLPHLGLFRLYNGGAKSPYAGLFGFVESGQARDAAKVIAQWRELAAQDQFSLPCTLTFCLTVYQLAPSVDAQAGGLFEVILECVTRNIAGHTGAPEYCAPILLRGEAGEYVAALTALAPVKVQVNRGITSKYVLFTDGPKPAQQEAISSLVRRSLSGVPLSLTVADDDTDLVGTTTQLSQVLSGWNESTTVRASMIGWSEAGPTPSGADGTVSGIRVGLAITQYINKRNTNEWRMPDPAQDERYEAAVIDGMIAEAARGCPSQMVRRGPLETIVSCPTGTW